ncbi:MAG TPA: Hpt domain-containing protein [Pseudolabrys sp.]|nr:Hpt domain-containing protein [Pseudolabrys sp.]
MEAATTTVERPLAAAAPVIDRAHLAHVTFGDRHLEDEVLQLFDRQATLLMARIGSTPAAVASLAHTLKGSATSIGAFNVARAAQAVELATAQGAREAAIGQLAAAVDEARAAISEMLRTP